MGVQNEAPRVVGSAWGDWANYVDSPLRAFENELGVQALKISSHMVFNNSGTRYAVLGVCGVRRTTAVC